MKLLTQINIPRPGAIGGEIPVDNYDPRWIGYWISKLLQYAIVIAGLIFFAKLISAGFSYLTSAGDSGKIQAATKEITNSLIGLILVISVFFIKQILVVLFNIKI